MTVVMLTIALLGSLVTCLIVDKDTGSAIGWWLMSQFG